MEVNFADFFDNLFTNCIVNECIEPNIRISGIYPEIINAGYTDLLMYKPDNCDTTKERCDCLCL